MKEPPPYPRVPHLWATPGTAADDRVVPVHDRAGWLSDQVLVEEKLDGANVSVWADGGCLRVASRGGPGAMDRAGQLGPLRARVNAQYERLLRLVGDGSILYAEWLWLTHTVSYDRLPDHLVALDVLLPGGGFADPVTRDQLFDDAGLVRPPRLFSGILGTRTALEALIVGSRFGTGPMEGVVLRRRDGRRCKVVRCDFVRAADNGIGRARNRVRG